MCMGIYAMYVCMYVCEYNICREIGPNLDARSLIRIDGLQGISKPNV